MPHPDYHGPFGNEDCQIERDDTRERMREAREAWDEDQWAGGVDEMMDDLCDEERT